METLELASELEQQTTDAAIAAVRRKASNSSKLLYSGSCYYCNEDVPSPRVFCDAGCRDDWQHERDRRRINSM